MRIDAVPIDDAARQIVAGEVDGAVHLCNAYTLSLASRHVRLAEVLQQGGLNLPDGMPLIWVARRLGFEMTERVYGPDLMAKVLDIGRSAGRRHYLYGATTEVLDRLVATIASKWPGAEIVGIEAPPFDDELAVFEAASSRIAASGADVVWVGLGTPKQDHVADALAGPLDATIVAVGAAFDFIAGTKRQAPRWMQTHGLEWLFRFASEPRRLWKRYLLGNARFVACVLRERPALCDAWSERSSQRVVETSHRMR